MHASDTDSRPGPRGILGRPIAALLLVASLLAAAIPMASPAAAQTTGSLAAYTPADSLFYAELNVDPESDQVILLEELIERANLDSLLTTDDQDMLDDSMAMATDTINGDVAFFVGANAAEDLSVDKLLGDVSSLTDDPTSIASEIPGGWAALIRPEDPDELYETIVDSLGSTASSVEWSSDSTPSAADAPAYETTEYEGYEILSTPADEYGSGQAVALVDDVIVVGTVVDDIQLVIDVATGESDALETRDDFEHIREALPDETLAFGYVNGPAIGLILAASSDANLSAISSDLVASLVAFQGFAIWADEPGIRMDSVAIPAPGTELPVPDQYDATFTDLVPADTMFFAGGTNLGANPGMDALALALAGEIAGISPDDFETPVDPEAVTDEVFAEAEDVLGFNLRTDVLDQLTGEWAIAGTTDLSTGSALLISEVDDPATVEDVVALVTDLIEVSGDESFTISNRTIAGAEVTVIELDAGSGDFTIEFGVIGDKLAVGVNGWFDLLDVPGTDPLSADAGFAESLGYLPSNITGIVYVDLGALIPLVADTLESFTAMVVEDADPSCGDYASQEEAQAAYDEDSFENYQLDLDWDGEACEDYFAAATPVATGNEVESINITALTAVTWAEDGRTGSSAIIVIGG